MLKGANLLKRRKKTVIKRKSFKALYYLIAALILSLLLFFTGFYLNKYFPDFLSPLAREKFKEGIELEKALKKESIKFIKITPQSDLSFLVELIDKEEVIFTSKKDFESQIASLQLIAKQLTIEGKRFKRLDFRYDKPMIMF